MVYVYETILYIDMEYIFKQFHLHFYSRKTLRYLKKKSNDFWTKVNALTLLSFQIYIKHLSRKWLLRIILFFFFFFENLILLFKLRRLLSSVLQWLNRAYCNRTIVRFAFTFTVSILLPLALQNGGHAFTNLKRKKKQKILYHASVIPCTNRFKKVFYCFIRNLNRITVKKCLILRKSLIVKIYISRLYY